jgi:large subunit ribosomal protein L1
MMPNPKAGTVTFDVGKAVEEIKGGKLEFRVDKNGVVHAPVGRASFDEPALLENVQALVDEIVRIRPASAKGKYLKSVHLSSTMGPSVVIDTSDLMPK